MSLSCADAFDVLPALRDNSVSAVITDPPYGTTSKKWDKWFDLDLWWKEINRILVPNGICVMFSDQPFTSMVVMSNWDNFRYDWLWDKEMNGSSLNAWKRPIKRSEDILVFSQQTPRWNVKSVLTKLEKPSSRKKLSYRTHDNKQDGSSYLIHYTDFPLEVLRGFRPVRAKQGVWKHPTQKPVKLMSYLINLYTREGDVVLDPFMGAGTTGVACKALNRPFIGVEKNEEYFIHAKERINEEKLILLEG